jgi:hypothetical protein
MSSHPAKPHPVIPVVAAAVGYACRSPGNPERDTRIERANRFTPSTKEQQMAKISVVLLADTETHGDLGRVANALALTKEAKGAGDEVELVFDGAGTQWVRELSRKDSKLRGQFEKVRDRIAGACEFCSGAYGVTEDVRAAGVRLLSEFEGHPSLRTRIAQGYQVVTF